MDEIQALLSSKLGTAEHTIIMGQAKVLQIFKAETKKRVQKVIAGCMVESGHLTSEGTYQVLRNNQVIWSGDLESLRLVKEKVSSVEKGKECGLKLEGFDGFLPGDVIRNLKTEMQQRTFDDNKARELNVEAQKQMMEQSAPVRSSLAFRAPTPEKPNKSSGVKKTIQQQQQQQPEVRKDDRINLTNNSSGWKTVKVKPKEANG